MSRRPIIGGVTPARVLAAETLADLRKGFLLDPSFERRAGGLDARDRRWAQELLWGTLRHRGRLDTLLAERVSGGLARLDADVIDLLRLGAYQLLEMTSVPPYAAIAQTVELAKRRHGIGASKLVNAVLRRLERDREAHGAAHGDAPLTGTMPADPREALAARYSHPQWLVERWADRWPLDDVEALLAANNREAPVVARPWGLSADALAAELTAAGVRIAEPAPGTVWARDSLQLAPGASLTELGAFRQGHFHIQDPASTLVTQYAAFPEGATVADLCAAPGGKSVELARTAAVVYSGDRSHARLQRVRANVRRLGVENLHPFVGDAREPAVGTVDALLLDAPCTGTGTFRRHPDARWRLKPSDMAVMPALQRQILRAASQVVKPGGLLVYSTCSLEPEENDGPVDEFLASHPDWTLEPPPAGAVPDAALDGGRLRVLPQRHGVDGAFAARLRRAG
jgi:16S rRNA (cytosine967-C5)-methyltransferase